MNVLFARRAWCVLILGLLPVSLFAQDAGAKPAEKAATKPAKGKTTTEPNDPAVMAMADGKVRLNASLGVSEAYLPAIYVSSHASNLLQLKNGDIVCVWFSGVWEGDSNVGIVISRLKKGSTQWEKTQLIDREEGFSYQNPVVFQAPDGTVHVFHTTQEAHKGEANAHVLEVVSTDNGETWSKPKVLFDKPGAFSRHPLLVMKDGTWLFPMTYVTSKGINEGSETNYSVMELSSDGGKNWKECMVKDSYALVQPTVVKASNGGYISFFRDRRSKWIYESVSADGCRWTAPVPTVVPNNNASVQAFRLQDGHLVMIFDNVRKGPRRPVSVALSEDEGKTWKYVRDIELGRPELGDEVAKVHGARHEEYSYPSIMQAKDGTIYASYTFRRETIKVISFKEDWLKHGGTVGLYKPGETVK